MGHTGRGPHITSVEKVRNVGPRTDEFGSRENYRNDVYVHQTMQPSAFQAKLMCDRGEDQKNNIEYEGVLAGQENHGVISERSLQDMANTRETGIATPKSKTSAAATNHRMKNTYKIEDKKKEDLDEEDSEDENEAKKKKPRVVKNLTRNFPSNTTESLNTITRMSKTSFVEPNSAAKIKLHKILDPIGSSVRGGGRVVKPSKRGTPSKLSFKNKLDIFETRASPGLTTGLIELLQQDEIGLNLQINLAAVGGGGGAEMNSKICADQSEGGTQTGPRHRGGMADWAGQGLVERCKPGADQPTRCAVTGLGLESGGRAAGK